MSGPNSFDPGSVSVGSDIVAIVAGLAVLAVLVWLVLAWIGATMEFVFVETLGDQAASLRRGWGRHNRRGLRLFAFRMGLFILTFGLFMLTALLLFWDPITTFLGGGSPSVSDSRLVIGIVVLGVLGFVLGIVATAVHLFTTEFVVPIMLRAECGVLAGWGRLWPTIKAQWKQYVVYILVAIGLRIATSIAAGIVLTVVMLIVAIPFVIVGILIGITAVGSGSLSMITMAAIGALVLVFLLILAVVSAVVYVPVQSFHRYFALLFIGDVEADFDVLGELRPSLENDFERSASA